MRNDTCALILIFLFPQPSIVVRSFSQRLPRSRAGPLARPTPVRESRSGSGDRAGSGTGGPRAGGGAPGGKEGERRRLRSGSGGGDQEGTALGAAAAGLVASLLGLGISAESIADGCLSDSHGVPPRRCSGAASTTASDGPL